MKHNLFQTIFIGYFVLAAAPALAGEKVSGRALFSTAPLTTIPIGLIEDEHVLRHATARGSQMEITGADWLKDCSLLRTGTCDLVRGRGSCFGYQIGCRQTVITWWRNTAVSSCPKAMAIRPYKILCCADRGCMSMVPEYLRALKALASIEDDTSTTEYALEWSGEIERHHFAKPHESNPEER